MATARLKRLGWKVVVVWECQIIKATEWEMKLLWQLRTIGLKTPVELQQKAR